MTFFNQTKVQGIKQKRAKVKKIGAIYKTTFPIQDLYQRSGFNREHFEGAASEAGMAGKRHGLEMWPMPAFFLPAVPPRNRLPPKQHILDFSTFYG